MMIVMMEVNNAVMMIEVMVEVVVMKIVVVVVTIHDHDRTMDKMTVDTKQNTTIADRSSSRFSSD